MDVYTEVLVKSKKKIKTKNIHDCNILSMSLTKHLINNAIFLRGNDQNH